MVLGQAKKGSDRQLLQRREPFPKCLAVVLRTVFHDGGAVTNLTNDSGPGGRFILVENGFEELRERLGGN